tara:strand:+ start:220 stop:387 length:168 start_codon:yes stop_codon:yes gene_type:complete
MKKIPEEIANELWKALNKLEVATEIIKAWVGYMDSDLSEAEVILVKKSKEFLGEK